MSREPTILIVDDGPSLGDGPRERLDDYDVRRATDAEAALDALSSGVDVVALDRRPAGRVDAFEWVRDHEIDCPVVVLAAAVPPDRVDEAVVDEYLGYPVSPTRLRTTVERVRRRAAYDAKLREYFALASELATLETERARETLDGDPEYERLRGRLEAVRRELDEILADLPEEDGYLVATHGAGGARADG